MQNPHALCHQFGGQKVDTRHVAAWPGNIGDETKCHRVLSESKDNRYCGGCRLGGERPGLGEDGHHAGATTDQIGCQFRKTIVLAFRPAIFDDDAATLDITGLSQGLAKGGKAAAHRNVGRRGAEKSDHRHRRLLRARRERPRDCRAANKRDEVASSHYSITSSARRRIDVGNSRPIAFAVFKLTTSSNRVGCSTGSSAGVAPLRILATYSANRRKSDLMSIP